MAEIVLDQPQVGHLGAVGKVVAAGVAQHVRPHVAQARALARFADDVGNTLPGEGLSALRDEQPGKDALADGEIALDGAELSKLLSLRGSDAMIIVDKARNLEQALRD